MKLKELIEWIDTLPKEFLEYELVNAELGIIDNDYHYRYDKPITALDVDEKSMEILIMHDSENETDKNK